MADLTRRAFFRRIVEGPPPPKAHIVEAHCIALKGIECGACAGLCPDGVDALRLVRRRPEIDTAACTGCGDCVPACPTSPRAIQVR